MLAMVRAANKELRPLAPIVKGAFEDACRCANFEQLNLNLAGDDSTDVFAETGVLRYALFELLELTPGSFGLVTVKLPCATTVKKP